MKAWLARWTDHHRVPLLRGTDGLTYRERRRYAERYWATFSGPLDGASS